MSTPEDDIPPKSAVRAGRGVFFFVGVVCLVVAGAFSYLVPGTNELLAAAVLGAGLVLVWLGIMLPPRAAAHWGFWLPWFLPDD